MLPPSQQNPDRYKAKDCKRCGVTHRKRGPYCSGSCGRRRTWSDAQKAEKSMQMIEHRANNESENSSAAHKQNMHIVNKILKNPHDSDLREWTHDDILVKPVTASLDYNQFIDSGDIWSEV